MMLRFPLLFTITLCCIHGLNNKCMFAFPLGGRLIKYRYAIIAWNEALNLLYFLICYGQSLDLKLTLEVSMNIPMLITDSYLTHHILYTKLKKTTFMMLTDGHTESDIRYLTRRFR